MAKKQIKESSGSLGNYIVPKGNVTVSFEHNSVSHKKAVYHNSAKEGLLKYIRDALYGDYIIAQKPGRVRICTKDSTGSLVVIDNTPYFNLIPEATDATTQNNVLKLYFRLQYDFIKGKTIYGMKLYSEYTNVEYAEVDFTKLGGDPITAPQNTNIKVEWQLIVTGGE